MSTKRSSCVFLGLAVLLLVGGASAREFTGENDLGVEPEQMRRIQEGLERVYQRRYPEARSQFAEMKELYPDSPAGAFGTSVVYLSMMLENADDSYRAEYAAEADEALALAAAAVESGQDKGWNTFLYAGIVGIGGLDRAQQGDLLGALNRGWDAIQSMQRVRRLEPGFADADLGIGIYNYWRTLVTEDLAYLPRFGDHKDEGLAQMQRARDEGLLVWVGGSFALAYAHKDARDYDRAIAECLALQAEYPDNVINNQMLGYLYTKNRDYDEALAAFDRVRAVDPENRRVVWHLGELSDRMRDDEQATEHYARYLQLEIPDRHRSQTHDRLGQIAERQDQLDMARRHYQAAVAADPANKRARRHLDDLP